MMMQLPTVIAVTLVPVTEQMLGEPLEYVIANGEVVVANGAIANGVALNAREAVACAGKVMVWLAFATVMFRTEVAVPDAFIAVRVAVNDPA